MPTASALLLLAVSIAAMRPQAAGLSGSEARRIQREAANAVAAPDAIGARVRERWTARLRVAPGDRAALLALTTFWRLSARYDSTHRYARRLLDTRVPDAASDYAQIERGAALLLDGSLAAAESSFADAAVQAERRADPIARGDALLGVANARSRSRPPSEVLAVVDEAARSLRGRDPRLEAEALCLRASLMVRIGASGAVDSARQGLAIARRANEPRQQARCYHMLAQERIASGDTERGERLLDSAAAGFRAVRDLASVASTLQWRGYLLNVLARPGEARPVLREALRAGEQARARSAVGWTLINLGMVSLTLDDPVTAYGHLRRAVDVLGAQGDQWGLVTARSMLGGVHRSRGELGEARATYLAVLAWADSSRQVQTQFNMQQALAVTAELAGDLPEAERRLAATYAIADANGMQGWRDALSENAARLALRRGKTEEAKHILRRYLGLLADDQHHPRYSSRARLAEAFARAGDLAAAETELTAAAAELEAFRRSLPDRELRRLALQVNDGADRDLGVATVIAALALGGRVEGAFALADQRRARELLDALHRRSAAAMPTPPPAATTREVRGLLDDSTALVQYVTGRFGESTTAFVLMRSGISAHRLPSIDSLAPAIDRFVRVVESGADPRVAGRAMGKSVLAPIVRALPAGITRLVIVPDGAIARIPFDALVLPDGRFALERFAIGLAPSSASWLALRRRPSRTAVARVLAIGDPAFADERGAPSDESEILRGAFADVGGLTRLGASASEARQVARFGASATVWTREAASEAALRAVSLADFGVIHFATHALVDDHASARSALALAPGAGHDGFLGLAELSSLTLRAELVVLSACRTARGVEIDGEGVEGLATALLHAGARSVVATQWRIGDERTRPFVTTFYRALSTGQPVAAALREAKIARLRAGAPASEWAAFAALGDPLVTVPLRPALLVALTDWRLLLPAMLFALAAGGYGATRRKRAGAP